MLVDNNGKIFGKFNIIDCCVVLLIFMIVGGVVYKVAKSASNQGNTASKTIYFTVKAEEQPKELTSLLKKNQKLLNNDDTIDAWVKNIKVQNALETTVDSKGNILEKRNPLKRDLIAVIRAKVSKNDNVKTIKVGVQEVTPGSQFSIKTSTVLLKGTVVKLNK